MMVHRIHVTLCDAATNIGAPEVGEVPGCSANHPPPPFPRAKKKIVDRMISKVLRDLFFSLQQPLESPDDWYSTLEF